MLQISSPKQSLPRELQGPHQREWPEQLLPERHHPEPVAPARLPGVHAGLRPRPGAQLPANLNLEGHSIEEAKKLLDEFKEVKDQVIGECPLSFTELQVQLKEVALIRNSGADTMQDWAAGKGWYRWERTQPGYQAKLHSVEGGAHRLFVTGPEGVVLLDKTGKPKMEFKDYLDHAASRAKAAIDAHAAEVRANTSKGTAAILSTKQINILRYQGFTVKQIDCLPLKQARGIISAAMDRWNAQREQQAQQEATAA